MALITLRVVNAWTPQPPFAIQADASRFYISLPSRYLSEPYELKVGDRITGTIEKVWAWLRDEPIRPELEGREITFILHPTMGSDNLFIAKRDWEEFREWGLVEPLYRLGVRLERAERDAREITLYSKLDKQV